MPAIDLENKGLVLRRQGQVRWRRRAQPTAHFFTLWSF